MSTRDEVEAALDFIPSDEQFVACTRSVDSYGKPFYRCQSESDPDTTWTQRWQPGRFWPRCNCPNGLWCWHNKTAMYKERLFQESGEEREQKAVAKYGSRAYEREPFSLLKTA